MTTHHFHFAIPRSAPNYSTKDAEQHIAKTFDIAGTLRHVRSEPDFDLYCIDHEAGAA